MTKVFVYGTLRRGFGNYRRLLEGNSRFIGEAATPAEFTLLDLGSYPGLVRGGETAVHGEVFEVDAATLARLDRLEGHPSFYERQGLTVQLGSETVQVQGYVLPESYRRRCDTIPSGVWGRVHAS